ncbi:MAG: FtsX-like permease family protein [Lachnospiraceae bacterium]|nr:FtsX-like permease family protein [Lachnospiraceae bacterium]
MYWRMLKRDLKDKVGLNIVLCIFMIISATLLVMSTGFLYTLFGGINKTYEKCNTSDVIFCVAKSVSDAEGQRKTIEEVLRTNPEMGEILVSERVLLPTSRIEFEGVDKRSTTSLYDNDFLISPVSREQNIPYDRDDKQFSLKNGCVALPQTLANYAGSKPGDKIRLTTDMGNIYEFTVSHIFKDPSSVLQYRVLFSDEDFASLMKEFSGITDFYEIKLAKQLGSVAELREWGWQLQEDLTCLGPEGRIQGAVDNIYAGKTNTYSDAAMVSLIIGIFMALMGVSLILLIFMSISFSLRATIKREEREIGMMKAIGVDSLSYRSLFIVKYIVFALVGAVIGSVAGTALCRFMIRNFISNTLNPDPAFLYLLGAGSSVVFILLMLAFSFLSLRRMRKISVMDTIHGENRGERFRKLPGVFLHKSRKTSVPFFLALCDITGRIKRYRYLILSYMTGMVVILMVVQLKATIVSDDFRRTYWNSGDREVMIRPEEDLRDRLVESEGSYRNVFFYYERYYGEHGIPLDYQIIDQQNAMLLTPEGERAIVLNYGDYELDKMKLVKGGEAPKLPNEVIVSHVFKNSLGILLGDTITVEYEVYGEDGFSTETVQRDFIVTGYVESLQDHGVFMTKNGDDIVSDDWDIFSISIGGDESEYKGYVEKMRELNEDIQVWDYDQVLEYDMGSRYGSILDLLLAATGIIMTVTTFAMTFLYQQIFIEEETSDVAMLKSLGVGKGSIRGWHYERMLLLVAVATAGATLLSFTLSKLLFGKIGTTALDIAEFTLASPPLPALLGLALAVAVLISLVLMISFRSIDQIKIWRIRNE